jgi:phage tail P2-like protein
MRIFEELFQRIKERAEASTLLAEKASGEVYKGGGLDFSKLWNLKAYAGSGFEELLPYFAWGLNVPVWRDEWSIEQKINFLNKWLYCRSIAGTVASIEDAVAALGSSGRGPEGDLFRAEIIESPELPFFFLVRISSAISTSDKIEIDRLIRALKPARSGFAYELRAQDQEGALALSLYYRFTKILRLQMGERFTVITDKGRELLTKALTSGQKFIVKRVAFGDGRYQPTGRETKLTREVLTTEVADVKPFSRTEGQSLLTGFNITASLTSDIQGDFDITEVGVFVFLPGEPEVLFSIDSRTSGLISRKVRGEELLLNVDLFLSAEAKAAAVVTTGDRLRLTIADETALFTGLIAELSARVSQLETELTALKTPGGNP